MSEPSPALIEAISNNPALLDELLWQNCQRQIMENAPAEIQDELNKLNPDEPTPPEIQEKMTRFAKEYMEQFYKEVAEIVKNVSKKVDNNNV